MFHGFKTFKAECHHALRDEYFRIIMSGAKMLKYNLLDMLYYYNQLISGIWQP